MYNLVGILNRYQFSTYSIRKITSTTNWGIPPLPYSLGMVAFHSSPETWVKAAQNSGLKYDVSPFLIQNTKNLQSLIMIRGFILLDQLTFLGLVESSVHDSLQIESWRSCSFHDLIFHIAIRIPLI